jgi:pimeloyl-ACP methyl ester carboxylesterase
MIGHVAVDAGQVAVDVQGSGPRVLLVHGVPGSRSIWDDVVEQLVARGFQTLAVDLLGVGASSRPTSIEDLRITGQAAAVTAVLDRFGPSIVVGHDYGAPISVTIASRSPQLVSGLVLASGNLFTDTPIPFPLSLVVQPLVGPIAATALFSGLGQRAVLKLGVATPGVRLDTDRLLGDRDQQRATTTIFRHAMTHPTFDCDGVEAALPGLEVPTTIVWGDRDLYFDLDTPRRAAELIPNATLEVQHGAGHFLPVERPDAFTGSIVNLHQLQSPA